MTICVAYTYKGKSFIASDTLVTMGDEKTSPDNSKIIKFKGFYCAYAGETKLRTILLKLAAKKNVVVKDEIDAAVFRDRVVRSLEKDDDIQLLIVTKKGEIFNIDRTCVLCYTKKGYNAIGSGSAYALPVLKLLYPDISCIEKSIEAAMTHSVSCGGEIAIVEV